MKPLAVSLAVVFGIVPHGLLAQSIDRQALVTRHNPVLREFDPSRRCRWATASSRSPPTSPVCRRFLRRSSGRFHWAHFRSGAGTRPPNPNGWSIDKFNSHEFDSAGRKVGYADIPGRRPTPEVEWLRSNPHRLHLGRIGFRLSERPTARRLRRATSRDIEQTLDLWNGVLVSRFKLEGEPVEVETIVSSARWISSPCASLAAGGEEAAGDGVDISLRHRRNRPPIGAAGSARNDDDAASAHGARFARQLDNDTYQVGRRWTPGGTLNEVATHRFRASPAGDCSRRWISSAALRRRKSQRACREFRGSPRRRSRTGTILDHRRRDRPFRQPRPALARAGAADRALAVSHGDPVLGPVPAGGNGPHLQQLVRQVSSRNALVARGPLRAVGSAADCWSGASTITSTSCRARRRPPGGKATRRALAQDDGPERGRIAVHHRAVPHLAAAASDLLRRAVLPRAPRPRHAGKVSATSSSRRPSSWLRTPPGTRPPSASCSARRCSARRKSSPRIAP